MTVLAGTLQRAEVRRALAAAVALDTPTCEALEPTVPRWDSLPLLKRLLDAGELVDGRWRPEVRAGYQAILAAGASPVSLVSGSMGTPPGMGPGSAALDRLAEADRPREKALRSGIGELDDAELVALLLRTGCGDEGVLELAQRLLAEFGGLAGLARSDLASLQTIKGVGEAKATELAAACELGRRLAAAQLRERPVLDRPELAAALLAPLAVSLPHEQLWCLPLDPRSRLIGAPRVVTQGDVDGTEVPVRAVLRLALAAGATSFLVAHNHPTGDPSPSPADAACTRRLVQAARAVELPLQDHLILGDGGRFTSLRRNQPELWGRS